MKRITVTVTGPSASGKTELVKKMVDNYGFEKLVSVTTRPMREGEVEGKDYYFIDEARFTALKAGSQLLQEVNFNGFNYGTTIVEMELVFSSGHTPVVIVEPGGVDQFKTLEEDFDFKVHSVFIDAPYDVLEQRFKARIATTELTEYDINRLEAIKVEADDWYWQKEWCTILHNPSNDLSVLDWFCKRIVSEVGDLMEKT